MKQRNTEKGSALFIILIGIVLFAALSFVVAQMFRGQSSTNLTREKVQLSASEMLEYANGLRAAVQNMKISNGCTDTDISFENAIVTGYAHSPATRDACMIFNQSGGGMAYVEPQEVWLDSNHASDTKYGEYVMLRSFKVNGLGSEEADLAVALNYVQKEICLELNTHLDITNPSNNPPKNVDDLHTTEIFTGAYDSTSDAVDAAQLNGKPMGCVQSADGSNNVFYQVLIAR